MDNFDVGKRHGDIKIKRWWGNGIIKYGRGGELKRGWSEKPRQRYSGRL